MDGCGWMDRWMDDWLFVFFLKMGERMIAWLFWQRLRPYEQEIHTKPQNNQND